MNKKTGASLLNVMVFLTFTMMIAAQVFFFAKWSVDSVAEDREIMMYRITLDSLVDDAKLEIKNVSHATSKSIEATYANFYDDTKKWEYSKSPYYVSIHDLNYTVDPATFNRSDFISQSRDKRIFAAMPPLSYDTTIKVLNPDGGASIDKTISVITNSFYLIRARAELPGNYYGATLMYQVLVSTDEPLHNYVDTLSFQEVWF